MDTGNGVCTGCSLPACLVLSEIAVYQEVDALPQDVFILTTPSTRQYITWQGGSLGGAECSLEVPVRRATWGSIKATYR